MIENLVKAATCQVICGDELGTGYLVAEKLILSARHCVLKAVDNGTPINLKFSEQNCSTNLVATIVALDEGLDVCLLSIKELQGAQAIKLDATLPREGSDWYSFGYPVTKESIGHRVSGTVAKTLETPKLKMDIDLTVDVNDSLSNYDGFSGAAIICEGAFHGMIRLRMDGTLGAISVRQLQRFLETNGVQLESNSEKSTADSRGGLAERSDFQHEFEALLSANASSYVFLEGAQGIGKTLFCEEFKPVGTSLLVLGTYSFTPRGRNGRWCSSTFTASFIC